MTRRTITLCVMCAFIALILPAISEAAQWTYPLAANLLENKNGNLVLANRENLLDEDFVPNNLVSLSLRGVDGPHELRREAADALYELFRTAEQDGFLLYIKSSYRSYQTQNTMYRNRLEKYGRDDGVVAYPGSSDHQTGLGVDVLNRDWAKRDGMTTAFGNTDEAKWIEAHCADFGFILATIALQWVCIVPIDAFFRLLLRNKKIRRFFSKSYTKGFRRYMAPGI